MELRKRFKGLDLIDRVPEDLWPELQDILQEAVIKTIPNKKKCKKAKWFSEEALQATEKRRKPKDKGEKDTCLTGLLISKLYLPIRLSTGLSS